MIFGDLKNKTWIDWIKIVVAIDIAGVGIGLILGFDMHVFAYMFGFLSRTIFGVLYVFLAVLIFKRIFPQELAQEEHEEAKKMDEEIVDTTNAIKKRAKKIAKKIMLFSDTIHEKIDMTLDRGEEFVAKRKQEAKDEIKKMMK